MESKENENVDARASARVGADLVVVHTFRNLWTAEGHFFYRIGALEDAKRNLYSCERIEEQKVQKIGAVKQLRGLDGEKWSIRPGLLGSKVFRAPRQETLEIDFALNKMRVPELHNGWDGLETWCPFEPFNEDSEYFMTYYPYEPNP